MSIYEPSKEDNYFVCLVEGLKSSTYAHRNPFSFDAVQIASLLHTSLREFSKKHDDRCSSQQVSLQLRTKSIHPLSGGS